MNTLENQTSPPQSLLAPESLMLPINAVERETGISKELLRIWERRYQFPQPERDAHGDRIYPLEQIKKLLLLRQLLDLGYRPGKIIHYTLAELTELIGTQQQNRIRPPLTHWPLETQLLKAIKSHEPFAVLHYLSHHLMRCGLERFLIEVMQPAIHFVNNARLSGMIELYETHLFNEQSQSLIRQATAYLRPSVQKPRILLTTVPNELHALELLITEAFLRLDEVDAVSFGIQMPISEIKQATQRLNMDVVLLSFSEVYPNVRADEFIEMLRLQLPAKIEVWINGYSSKSPSQEVRFIQTLEELRQAVQQWQSLATHTRS